ncbi:MAG TPA: DUF2148 domain-containing protein [Bacillota bacterium]|nr:DUF2148 domain-containing protein [Bacillota bacterium]
MGINFEEQVRPGTVLEVAKRMMAAARTAPKGCGVDNLVIATLIKPEIEQLAAKMTELVEAGIASPFFMRDAANIQVAEAVVLIGTKIAPLGLKYCGLCGFANCGEKSQHPEHPCAFNTGDLGIAIGSAVSVAMEARLDNRVMYTLGMAVRELKWLGEDCRIIYGIPLSCTGKNPFFDRK